MLHQGHSFDVFGYASATGCGCGDAHVIGCREGDVGPLDVEEIVHVLQEMWS